MDEKLFNRIKNITEIQATAGFEYQMRDYLKDELKDKVDRIEMDGLGGVFGIKASQDDQAPRLMLAAHMDEVGFILAKIQANGLLQVRPLGGWNPNVVSSQRFSLQTDQGDLPIVSASIPPHLLKNKSGSAGLNLEDILFDGGFTSKEEAESYGVKPGQAIIPDVQTIPLANGKTILGKAWDNRFGVLAIIDALEEVGDLALANTLIAGANVQEEVGLRGTKGSVRKFKPDCFFAVDASPAEDSSGQADANGRLGDGVLIRIQDPGYIMPKEIKDFILDTAESHDIPYQYFVSKGGTDAVAAHQLNDGIPSGVLGVPVRYPHTHQSLFHIDDYYAAKDLLVQLIKNFDRTTLNTLMNK